MTTAVDDIEMKAPTKIPSVEGAPVKSEKTPHISIIKNISIMPPRRATPCTRRSFEIESSTPNANKIKTTPSCANVSTLR
jgi:hypothetical protein